MSRPRRPSVSIHDYPEDLNPFKDGTNPTNPHHSSFTTVELRHGKEPKNKFWTFGRSKKKRSNSFSVKSAWSGLFGKRKDPEPEPERRTTITTVSTTYQNGQFSRPVPPPRSAKDQQEFEEAFGTFTRRKKYSMEGSSHYGSNLTVNGDPARLYNGSPQDTTASILGELTPKPPARRFGQVSPRPKDEIPPLEFEPKDYDNQSTAGDVNERISEEVPIPAIRRSGRRSIPRVNVLETPEEEDRVITGDSSIRDENENLPDDFVFRRCSQDAVRRSNLSINSCVSTASGMSTLGRRKRRAPQPPQRLDTAENPEEKTGSPRSPEEQQISERIDIAKVTEDIQEMTKQSQNIDESISSNSLREEADGKVSENETAEISDSKSEVNTNGTALAIGEGNSEEGRVDVKPVENSIPEKIEIEDIQITRVVEDKLEIITDINENSESDEVELRKKTGGISRSDSFSVKEQIEQIERQIKELESKNLTNNNNVNAATVTIEEIKLAEPSDARLSMQAKRKHFFKNMVSNDSNGVKIQIKELPREQREIQVVKLTDPPVAVEAPKDPVKIVELHISEPIKRVPEIVEDINVNPLPKPRRHSQSSQSQRTLNSDSKNKNYNDSSNGEGKDTRGDSL